MAENESKYVADAPLVAIRRGNGTSMTFEDMGRPYLVALAMRMPGLVRRLLGKVGSTTRLWSRQALSRRAEPGTSWQLTSTWGARRLRVRDPKKSRYSAQYREALKEKFFGPSSRAKRPYGKLYPAARYVMNPEGTRVDVGWVNSSSAAFGKAVQAGLRGTKYRWEHEGDQPVTGAMRRALAAMGRPLRRSTTYLHSPERPLWRPLYDRARREIPQVVDNYLNERLIGRN